MIVEIKARWKNVHLEKIIDDSHLKAALLQEVAKKTDFMIAEGYREGELFIEYNHEIYNGWINILIKA